MSSLPSPAFAFLPNAPGAKYQAAASTPIVATLNNLASVSNTTWRVSSVDDLTFAALGGDLSAYALTISGPKNSVCTLTSAPAGTAGFLEATINGGINPLTGNIDPVMTYHVKWWVPTVNSGAEVICFNEQLESGPQGYLPLVNSAIRSNGAATVPGSASTSGGGSAVLFTFPMLANQGRNLDLSITAQSASPLGVFRIRSQVDFGFQSSGSPGILGTAPFQEQSIGLSPTITPTWSPSTLTLSIAGPNAVISGVVDNGSGHPRVSVLTIKTATPLSSQLTGQSIDISGIVGTGDAVVNGTSLVPTFVTASTFDLLGLTFSAGSYTSGGLVVYHTPPVLSWNGRASLT